MRRLLFAPLILGAGCQDYLFDQVCPEAIRESSIVVPALKPTPADILFVVDNSGSMADEQENLAQNFDRFINQVAGAGDYRIAVVTTDLSKTPGPDEPLTGQLVEFEGLQNFGFFPDYPNMLNASLLSSSCAVIQPPIAHGCFRGPDPTARIVDSNTMDAQTQIDVFGQNVRVGSCGAGKEEGLKAMITALENDCNEGFLRDGANLIVVIVSDEEDDDANRTPIDEYVQRLKAVKRGAAPIRVAVIVGFADGRASECSIAEGAQCGSVCDNPPPEGSQSFCNPFDPGAPKCTGNEACLDRNLDGDYFCDHPLYTYWHSCGSCSYYNAPDCCSATAGSRYVDFALAMEQEIVNADPTVSVTSCQGGGEGVRVACRIDTICQANFGDTLAAIARDLIPQGTYVLEPPASYPPGVSVTVKNGRFGAEGTKLTYGEDFQVTEDGKVLTLIGENTPREGEDIEIHFVVDAENRVEEPRGACVVSGSP